MPKVAMPQNQNQNQRSLRPCCYKYRILPEPRASPAPSKVTIGDRQPLAESLFKLKLPDLDSQQQSGNENDRSDNPMTSNLLLPPTPPRSSSNQNAEHGGNRTLQSEQQLTSSRSNAHEPPSPSTFILHLPNNEQGEQLPPPLSPININTQFQPPPLGHNPQHIPAETARLGAALATTSTTYQCQALYDESYASHHSLHQTVLPIQHPVV